MKKHYIEIDSLRGLAAFTVLISHFLLIFPLMEPDTHSQIEYNNLNIFKYSPLHIIWAGHEAVILFFLLSGFVLSLPYYKETFAYSRNWYIGYIIKRFFRIYVPYTVSLIVAISIIMAVHPSKIDGASDFVNRIWSNGLTTDSLLNYFLLIGEFNTREINPVIWSLIHEMRISIIFPFLMYFVLKVNYRILIISALSLSLFSYISMYIKPPTGVESIMYTPHYISIFLIGALIAKHINQIIDFAKKLNIYGKLCILVIAILAYSYKWIFFGSRIFHIHQIVNEWAVVIGASLFIILALSSNILSKILNAKPIHYLGKISFSLYLYHTIALLFVTHLIKNYNEKAIIIVLGFVLSFIMTILSYHFIEIPSINLGKRISLSKRIRVSSISNENTSAPQ